MTKQKPWYKSKAILMFAGTFVLAVLTDVKILAVIPEPAWKNIAAIVSALGILLRSMTDSQIRRKN
jgi:hypothetical protein